MTRAPQGTLRRQLLARLSVPLLAVMAVGAALTFAGARYFAAEVYDQWLYDSATALAAQIRPGADGPAVALPPPAVEMLEWDQIDKVMYDVTTSEGAHIFGNAVLPPPPRGRAGKPVFYDGVVGDDPVRLTAVTVPLAGSDLRVTVTVAETLLKRRAIVGNILLAILPIEAMLLALAGGVIWFAVTSALGSLDRLAADLGRIDAENPLPLTELAPLPTEVRPLVAALNGVIVRLGESRDAMRRFVANAAHQLRTPLAAMQIQTQRAVRETDPARGREALAAVEKAMVRLARVTQQVLTLARAEPGSGTDTAARTIDLAALARQELEHWADAAVARDIDLGYAGPQAGPFVLGDPQLLTDLIANLVDNAIRYSEPHAQVTLRLSTDPAALTVEDTGPGIPLAERSRVLERFYRPPTTKGSGSGLGLAIASEIAKRHHASLRLDGGEGGRGTVVTVTFERAVPPPAEPGSRAA